MCSEDVLSMLSDFPSEPKAEPLDDLFNVEPKSILTKIFETPDYYERKKTTSLNGASTPSGKARSDSSRSSSRGSKGDHKIVGGSPKTPKIYACEDFHSFMVREGGIRRERLSRLVGSTDGPRSDEDFVAFLARSIGIKDEAYINNLREALGCEPTFEYSKDDALKGAEIPVKMEVDQTNTELKVGVNEDAVSFFVRAGSWGSTSSMSDELASVGLDEDEDAESFLRRTGNWGSGALEFEGLMDSQFIPTGMGTFITAKQEMEALQDQELLEGTVITTTTDESTTSKRRRKSDGVTS